jgi:hypothetical protein
MFFSTTLPYPFHPLPSQKSGEVLYNGVPIDGGQFVVERTAAYIDQVSDALSKGITLWDLELLIELELSLGKLLL